jgi:hypothetical protein
VTPKSRDLAPAAALTFFERFLIFYLFVEQSPRFLQSRKLGMILGRFRLGRRSDIRGDGGWLAAGIRAFSEDGESCSGRLRASEDLAHAAMIDPRKKAKECDRAIETCTDPQRKALLTHLRELWVAIGNDRASGWPDWQVQAGHLDQLHADLVGSARGTVLPED